jgi:hypothetical protein
MVIDALINSLVCAFARTVCFRMVRSGEFELDTSEFMECFPEGRYKEFVPVGDDFEGGAILTVPFVKEEEGEILCGDIGASGDNLYVGTVVVRHRNNAVVALVLREGANEIDCH